MTTNKRMVVAMGTILAATGGMGCIREHGGNGGGSADAFGVQPFCSGTFVCDDGEDLSAFDATEDGDVCLFGGIELRPDGSVGVPGDPELEAEMLKWSQVDGRSLVICVDDVCLPCEKSDGDGSGGRASSEGSCTGSPRDCPTPGSCSTVEGCYLSLGSSSSTSDDYCAGSPYSCSGYHTESSCVRQGCDWE
jgi:hypothetical protein